MAISRGIFAVDSDVSGNLDKSAVTQLIDFATDALLINPVFLPTVDGRRILLVQQPWTANIGKLWAVDISSISSPGDPPVTFTGNPSDNVYPIGAQDEYVLAVVGSASGSIVFYISATGIDEGDLSTIATADVFLRSITVQNILDGEPGQTLIECPECLTNGYDLGPAWLSPGAPKIIWTGLRTNSLYIATVEAVAQVPVSSSKSSRAIVTETTVWDDGAWGHFE
ncbi:hypothetical protein KKG41_05175, partial [Patescibacteria group bacterium]|nr:hypothetical protein [Patescibacteria group bacterium]